MSELSEKDIGELIDEIHERGIMETDEKPLDYLGWYWRDIEYANISYYDGRLWINEAKKWGYPSYYPDDRDPIRDKARELLIESLENGHPPKKREFQRFLAEQCEGPLIRRDYDTGEETELHVSFNEETGRVDVDRE